MRQPIIERRRRPRVEIELYDPPYDKWPLSSAVQVKLTRRGIKASGFFDHFVGIEGWEIDWVTFDALRAELK